MKLNPHRLDLLNRFLLLCALIFGATSFSLKSSAELAASGPPTNNRTTNQPTSDETDPKARAKELIEACRLNQQPDDPRRKALFCCAQAMRQLIREFNESLNQTINPSLFLISCEKQAIGQQGEDYEVLKAKISSKKIRVYTVNGQIQTLEIDMKGTIEPGESEEDIKDAFQREITVTVQNRGCSLPDNFWNAQTGTGKLMVRDFVRPQSSSGTQEYQLKVKLNCRL
jgi:hypothetical protein